MPDLLNNWFRFLIPGFILSAFFFAGCSNEQIPAKYTGTWSNSIPIAGTGDTLLLTLLISDDELVMKQQYPRMSGIDKTSATYAVDDVQKIADGIIIYSFIPLNGITAVITIHDKGEDSIDYIACLSSDPENPDAEFSTCNEPVRLIKMY